MVRRLILAFLPLAVLLAIPFCLQKKAAEREGGAAQTAADSKLVIVTAHNKVVKDEFSRAFRNWYFERHGVNVDVDIRDVGGTSDAMRYLDDLYLVNFRSWYEKHYPGEWDSAIAEGFANPRLAASVPAAVKLARERFLASNVGIGIDIFWGGGVYDQNKNAEKGYAVDGGVMDRHPEWASPDVIPASFSSETLYDPLGRYYGNCLSSFGICYNPDRCRELGVPPPTGWDALGDGRFFGALAIGDPTRSGSVNKCYEMLIQQKMQEAPDLETGWRNAMTLLKQLVANSELISDAAPGIPMEVATGNAAAGICIDYYCFAEAEWSASRNGGEPTIVYVLPENGGSVTADTIQLLRGAPDADVAREFLDFVLSVDGQKLFGFRAGAPGGPTERSPLRPPIRRDLYREPWKQYLAQPDYDPYEASSQFTYRPEYTGKIFGLIRVIVRCAMLDAADELRAAWRAVIAAGGAEKVPEAWEEFTALPFTYAEAPAVAERLADGDSKTVAEIRRKMTDFAREHYRRAAELAREGR